MDQQISTTTFTPVTSTDDMTFQPLDYLVFSSLLIISSMVGIYFAWKEEREKQANNEHTTSDYLMAGRQMAYLPVAMSLMASFVSPIAILGLPVEFYTYGTMFIYFTLCYIIQPFLISFLYMPVFYDLQLASTYEYLRLRFDLTTKYIAIGFFIFLTICYGGVVVYGPSIALSAVTGFNEWLAIVSTGLVCIFYTTLGGLKAVIWTDVIQALVMVSGFISVVIQGSINFGGFGNIWRIAQEGGRIDFNHFEADPLIRHTFWGITIGGTLFWLSVNAFNQTCVQRHLCCKTKKEAQKAIFVQSFGCMWVWILAGMTGLTIYAQYKDCDPITSGKIGKPDQLLPYTVMDLLSYLPGIPGLFVAGVYSSSLSTISSGINSLSCVTIEDFIKPRTNWNERKYKNLSKILVIFYGAVFILFAYLASIIGGLLRMAFALFGIVAGPTIGVFTMGMGMPFINRHGAICGMLVGFMMNIIQFVGSVFHPTPKYLTNPLDLSTSGCNISTTMMTTSTPTYNISTSPAATDTSEEVSYFYNFSYIHVSLFGTLITMIVGFVVSAFTGFNKERPRDELLFQFLRSPDFKKTDHHKQNTRDNREDVSFLQNKI